MRRALILALLAAVAIAATAPPASARAPWKRRIDRIRRSRSIDVSVGVDGSFLYGENASDRRVPASNEKLLLSMALLDELGPRARLATVAATGTRRGRVVRGNLWLLGTGDPTVTGGGRYGRDLPLRPTRLAALARRVHDSGVRRIEGRVMGRTTYFGRDWWAPGWKPEFPSEEIALPTSLTFEGNVRAARHTRTPELYAARAMTRRLEDAGVRVVGPPGTGDPPSGLGEVARVRSVRLASLLRHMNFVSSNFFAEVLGKRLAVERYGRPGTIAGAGRAVEAWARSAGVDVTARDGSGLSYDNRASPRGIVRLLTAAHDAGWGTNLRTTLPAAGRGTLEDRLGGVRVRAKTGTLDEISTLSGWVWLRRSDTWAEFSIMSRGMPKGVAADVEDRIVAIVADRVRAPAPAATAIVPDASLWRDVLAAVRAPLVALALASG